MKMDEAVKELGKLTRQKATLVARCADLSTQVRDIDEKIRALAATFSGPAETPQVPASK